MLTTRNAGGLVKSQPTGEDKIMKIRMLRNTVAGGVAVTEGQIVDVSETDARLLIGIKKAEAVEDAPVSVETADAVPPALESTDKRAPRKK